MMNRSANIRLECDAEIVYWRGPAPFFYARLPPAAAEEIREVAKLVSYGWGVIPVEAEVNGVRFTTSLFPREETYYLPLRAEVRKRAGITVGDTISVVMKVGR